MKTWRSKFPKYRLAILLLPLILAGCGSPEERAQDHYKQALELIAKHDDREARLELFRSIKYKSDQVEVWRAMAGIDERIGSNQELFQDLRRIIELDPNDLDARLKVARMMVGGGAADAALKVIDAANEGEKPSAPLHALKAVILLRTQDNVGAVREAQRAFEIDPGNVDAVSLLASKKLSDGDADGALKLLDSIAVGPKDETRILLQKMQIFAKKGDLPQAESLLRKLISQNPKEPAFQAQLIRF